MTDPWFFGYGSLVNRLTHDHADAHPARLRDWRRAWRHTALRPLAYLTVVPAPGAEIEGLIARVPRADWLALDEREHAYDRVRATKVVHPLDRAADIQLYTIPEGKHAAPDRLHPVLLSYIDVVAAGYLAEFGAAGLTRFFDTTDGWDAPIADDRAHPRYSRYRPMEAGVLDLVDRELTRVGARKIRFSD